MGTTSSGGGDKEKKQESESSKKVKFKDSSEYDYSKEGIEGKGADDWEYFVNGSDGNYLSRAWRLWTRDWNMASSEQKTDLVLAAAPVGIVLKAAKTGGKLAVQFGKTENQIYHAFRHTDALGLDRSLVQSTIQNHFKTLSSQVIAGKPFNQIIEIGGQRIQYTAFKLSDGTFNIGRIHGIK